MIDNNPLEVSVHIDAAPETVFPFFTDPAKYIRWMGRDATLEADSGGVYRVSIREGVETSGRFVEIEAPRRIVFTWGWVGDPVVSPGSTRVEVTLTATDDGGTDVVLRHSGLPGEAQAAQHAEGWEIYLARLVVAASGGDPGPDPNG